MIERKTKMLKKIKLFLMNDIYSKVNLHFFLVYTKQTRIMLRQHYELLEYLAEREEDKQISFIKSKRYLVNYYLQDYLFYIMNDNLAEEMTIEEIERFLDN